MVRTLPLYWRRLHRLPRMTPIMNTQDCTCSTGRGRGRGETLARRRGKTFAPGSPRRIWPNTPRRWPSTSPPANGRNWTTSSGRPFPSAPAGAAGRLYPIGTNAINDRTIGEAPRAGRLCAGAAGRAASRWPAPSPTTRGIARGSSPSFVPRSWPPPASRSSSSTATAARRNFPSPSATSTAIAAS